MAPGKRAQNIQRDREIKREKSIVDVYIIIIIMVIFIAHVVRVRVATLACSVRFFFSQFRCKYVGPGKLDKH